MHRTVMLALIKPDALSSEVNGNGDVGNLTAPPSRALRLPYNQYKTFISRRVVIKVNYDTVAGILVARGGVTSTRTQEAGLEGQRKVVEIHILSCRSRSSMRLG